MLNPTEDTRLGSEGTSNVELRGGGAGQAGPTLLFRRSRTEFHKLMGRALALALAGYEAGMRRNTVLAKTWETLMMHTLMMHAVCR